MDFLAIAGSVLTFMWRPIQRSPAVWPGLMAALAFTAGHAQTARPAPPPAQKPSIEDLVKHQSVMLSGVTVTALGPCTTPPLDEDSAKAPHVVDTFPRKGSVVRPGLLFLRITFDKPMSYCSYRLVNALNVPRARLLDVNPQLSPDRKSFFFMVTTEPNTRDTIWFKSDKSPDGQTAGFQSKYGVGANEYELVFSTTGAAPMSDPGEIVRADPEMARIVAEKGNFLKLHAPRRDDGVHLMACQNCGEDLRSAYEDTSGVKVNAEKRLSPETAEPNRTATTLASPVEGSAPH
jgi:hypothetical protein